MKNILHSAATALFLTGVLTACGAPGVEGTYTPQGDAFFDSFTFLPDGKVEVVLIGVNHLGSYKVEDKTVTITAPDGTVSQLMIDSNGCLTHEIAGAYCKGTAAPAARATATASPSGAPASGGERYTATLAEGRIGLELLALPAGPDDFEAVFMGGLARLKAMGVGGMVFGNIHLADVRAWFEDRTKREGLKHVEPLWGQRPGRATTVTPASAR